MEILLLTTAIYACVVLICVTTVFLFAQFMADNSVMDIAYGPIFAISGWVTAIISQNLRAEVLLILVPVTLWAARLGIRIFRKNWHKPEDPRYAVWRAAWMERGEFYFIFRSYIQINLLQGIIITLVSLPIIIILSSIEPFTPHMQAVAFVGTLIWSFGFLYETIADWQLDRFIARKRAGTEAAKLMTQGLFKYSRRPNYFGETLCWWGLALMAMPLPFGYLALISPLLITFIVTRVTGPMLEEIFLKKYPEEYQAYMARTNYFIPWWPKQR